MARIPENERRHTRWILFDLRDEEQWARALELRRRLGKEDSELVIVGLEHVAIIILGDGAGEGEAA